MDEHLETSEPTLDELIIRVISGHASAAEERRLEQWRAESPKNESYYRNVEGMWSLTDPVARRAYAPPTDLKAILEAEDVEREEDGVQVVSLAERRQRRAHARVPLRWVAAVAASVAAVGLGIRLVGSGPPTTEPVATFTGNATTGTVVLGDGSFVRLAPGSRLDQWRGEGERRLGLTGRAFFAVAHDESRPFTVDVAGARVRVLGTRFELSGGEDGVRTVVLEGRVAVANEMGRVEALAGSVAEVQPGVPPTVSPVEDVWALLDWPNGLLVFQATPLGEVAAEVGRHFGRRVEVRGAGLASLRISAYFEQEGFEEVVQALCDVSGAECALTAEGAQIGPTR